MKKTTEADYFIENFISLIVKEETDTLNVPIKRQTNKTIVKTE